MVNITRTAPAIFAGGQVVHVHTDGSQTVESMAGSIDLGPADDQVFLILYGTGIRHSGTSVTVTVNGVSLPAQSAAQGSYPGLDQLNLALPHGLEGAGTVDLVVTVDGRMANTVKISIQ
jgi:uncharacterized protein (TIGR03437 family)